MGNIPRPRSITERAPVGWECGECRLEPVGINVAGTMQIEGMTLSSSTHTAGLAPDREQDTAPDQLFANESETFPECQVHLCLFQSPWAFTVPLPG